MNFKKVDFHIHSSSDYSRDFAEDDFITRIEEIDGKNILNVLAITDHNIFDIDLYNKLCGKNFQNLKIYPGVELNLKIGDEDKKTYGLALNKGREYFHAVVIFNPLESDNINERLEKLYGIKQTDNTYKEYSQKIKDNNVKLNSFFNEFHDMEFYFIPHENKSQTKRNLSNQFYWQCTEEQKQKNNRYKYSLYFLNNVGIDGKINTNNAKFSNNTISQELLKQYEEYIPYFTFSDNKTLEDIGQKYTWLNYNGEFENLILPFTSLENRVFSSKNYNNSPQKNINNYFNKIRYGNDGEIILSPGLNCVVGTRGSGKSSLLNSIVKSDSERLFNLKGLKLFKNDNIESNAYENILYLDQKSLSNLYDDKDNVQLNELPYFSEIKKNQIDKFKIEHNKIIDSIKEGFEELNKIITKHNDNYKNKNFNFIDNYSSNGELLNEATNNKKISEEYEKIDEVIENKIEELLKILKIEDDKNLVYKEDEEFVKNLNLLMDFIRNEKGSILDKVKELNLLELYKENNKRNKNITSFNKIIKRNNLEQDSDSATKEDNYSRELKYLKSTYELRKSTMDKVKKIEEKLKKLKDKQADSFIQEIDTKLIVKSGVEEESLEIFGYFVKSNIKDKNLLTFYNDIIFTNNLSEVYKNLGRKTKLIEQLEYVMEKYVEKITEKSKYELDLIEISTGKSFKELSPGTRADIILKLILWKEVNNDKVVMIMLDQPDDDLDNKTIKDLLVKNIRELKLRKQLLIISHSANVVINGDADNIILSKYEDNPQEKFKYTNGTITCEEVRKEIIELLDGGKDFMIERFNKYNFKMEER